MRTANARQFGLVAALLVAPSLASALGFWLESPPQQRPNPFDRHDQLAALPATPPPPPPPPPPPSEVYFDQMDAPPCGSYAYDDGTSSPALSSLVQESGDGHSGGTSYHHSYSFGSAWGAGFGFAPMGCGVSNVDARAGNPTKLFLWIKTDKDLSLYITLVEDAAVLGGNPEQWTSAPLIVIASNAWQRVDAPLAAFAPNGYFHGTQGKPMQNSVLDPLVSGIDIQYGAGTVGQVAEIYLDDIGFDQ